MDTFQREKVDKLLGKWYQFELKKVIPNPKSLMCLEVPNLEGEREREREREKIQDTLLDGCE